VGLLVECLVGPSWAGHSNAAGDSVRLKKFTPYIQVLIGTLFRIWGMAFDRTGSKIIEDKALLQDGSAFAVILKIALLWRGSKTVFSAGIAATQSKRGRI
jgi:hypothetical protein